jgi:protein-S-isoprenylcysteine O-methyltransferase Ste14
VTRMEAEEVLLISEFGDEYKNYRRRAWRLAPFVYSFPIAVSIFSIFR